MHPAILPARLAPVSYTHLDVYKRQDVLRISPPAEGTGVVVAAFAAGLRGERDPVEAARALNAALPYGACDGYWRGQPGLRQAAEVG